jgi:hypothetical protein
MEGYRDISDVSRDDAPMVTVQLQAYLRSCSGTSAVDPIMAAQKKSTSSNAAEKFFEGRDDLMGRGGGVFSGLPPHLPGPPCCRVAGRQKDYLFR